MQKATPQKPHARTESAVSPPDEPAVTRAISEPELAVDKERFDLARHENERRGSKKPVETRRHIPWRARTRKTPLLKVQQRDDIRPRTGPLVLTGNLALAASAKARANAWLDAGEFSQAEAELETAKSLSGPQDLELPVLISQAKAGMIASRGLPASLRSPWTRVYGIAEPERACSLDATKEFQRFTDENGLEPGHIETMCRFIYLQPGESPTLSDIRNMDPEAFVALLDALAFNSEKTDALALSVATLRLPPALPQMKDFCPRSIEHVLSGCGLAQSASQIRSQMGLPREANGVYELWELAREDVRYDHSNRINELQKHDRSHPDTTRTEQGTFTFRDLLELTGATGMLGVKLRADILAVGRWWGDVEVHALWRTHFDDESIGVHELRDRLRIAQASDKLLAVQPRSESLFHHWCGSCVKRGDLLREASTWLGPSAWTQRNCIGDTPLHSLCINPNFDISMLQPLRNVIPPHAWRARGREGSPLHALCSNCIVSGAILRVATDSWQDDDYIALLQTDNLGRTPVELLWQTCHDIGSNAARHLPSVGHTGLRRNLAYDDYHVDGMDALNVAAQMAARGAAATDAARRAIRQEMFQEMMNANLTVPELRTRAERAQVNIKNLDDQIAVTGYVVRIGACTNHSLRVGLLTQIKDDSRWGEVRMIAPAQIKLNWVDGSGGEMVSPTQLGEERILREDLLDERMGLLDLIAHGSLRECSITTFAQWVEGGNGAIVNDFAEWEKAAQAARASQAQKNARAIENARELAAQEEAGRRIFQALDKDDSSSLDAGELKVMLMRLNCKATKKQIAESRAEIGTDGSGDVTIDEFLAWWCQLDERQRSLVVEAHETAISRSRSKKKPSDPDGAERRRKKASGRSGLSKTAATPKLREKKKKKK